LQCGLDLPDSLRQVHGCPRLYDGPGAVVCPSRVHAAVRRGSPVGRLQLLGGSSWVGYLFNGAAPLIAIGLPRLARGSSSSGTMGAWPPNLDDFFQSPI
jgi:hypothetical protein